MNIKKSNSGCCSCSTECCTSSQETKTNKRRISIDFLFLDLSVCTRCQGTDSSLDEAISEVSKVLEAAGVEVTVNKINVVNEELAKKYRFISSPTIRVNGRDIQMDIKESVCESCGDLCGDEVDCRVWSFQGTDYNIPPKALIVDALLQEVYSPKLKTEELEYFIPKNLKKYFDAYDRKNMD